MKPLRPLLPALCLVSVLTITGVGSPVRAQESSPAATPGGPSAGYPVAIHEGTCAQPNPNLAWDLGDAIGVGINEVSTPNAASLGTVDGPPLLVIVTTIDVRLDDLGNEPHIIAVRASTMDGTIVACGSIGGLKTNDTLAIPLISTSGSTVVGVAILEEAGEQTNVTVYVFDAASTPGGTPAA